MNLKRMQASYKTLEQSALAPPGGVRDGTVVRALASHQYGLGSNPGVDAICGLSLLLVVSSLPCSKKFLSGYSGFPLSSKTNISNSTRNQVDKEPLCGFATPKSLFVINLLILFIYMTTVSNKIS